MRRLTLALLFLAGCAEAEPQYGRRVAKGDHIEIWASSGIEVCGGNVSYMDSFTEALRLEVGPHPEAEENRRFYVLNEIDWKDYREQVDCRGEACTSARRTIYTRGFAPSLHEVTHGELSTGGDRLFEEGLAVLYGGPRIQDYPFQTDIREALESDWIGFEDYPAAGHFTRFLVDRFGIRAFLSVKDASSESMSVGQINELFEVEFGESLDTSLAAYDEEFTGLCKNSGYRKALVECSADMTPWDTDGEQWVVEESFDCGDADVLGPKDDEIYVIRAFEVEELGRFRFEVEGEQARAWFFTCDGTCMRLPREGPYPFEPGDFAVEATPGNPATELVYPGRYWVRVARPLNASSQAVSVSVIREG